MPRVGGSKGQGGYMLLLRGMHALHLAAVHMMQIYDIPVFIYGIIEKNKGILLNHARILDFYFMIVYYQNFICI